MNTEQKAKAYDEALDRAKKELQTCGSTDCDAARQIFRFFPTLRESEDERIRKEIIDFIQWAEDRGMTRHDYHQAKRPAVWIAYLERQKETANSFTDGVIEVRSFQRGIAEGRRLERQKECVADSSKTSAEEDERIRARLIEYFQGFLEGYEDCYKDGGCVKWEGLDVKSILAWLEKQKELPFVKDVVLGLPGLYFYDGERMHFGGSPAMEENPYDFAMSQQEKQKEQKHPNGCFTCDEYKKGYEEGRRNGFTAGYNKAMKEVEQKEQKPVVTLGETYHVDTLGTQQVIAGKMPQKPAEWSEEDEHRRKDAVYFLESAMKHYADTSEIEKAIAWLKSLPERFNLQPKQEWSDEDEKMIDTIVSVLGQYIDYKAVSGIGSGYATPRYNKEITWLKSLRPVSKESLQPHWKPSEEQMEALNKAIPVCMGVVGRDEIIPLESLYEQLKKL